MVTRSLLFWEKARCLSHGCTRRDFSKITPPNLICYGLPYSHKEEDWETVDEFLKREQLLRPVPRDRLIMVRPGNSHLSTEPGKRLMWSAAMITYAAHCQGISCSGLFSKDVLHVYKPLGVLAVKQFIPEGKDLNEDLLKSDYAETKSYIISLLEKQNGPHVTKLIPDSLKRWLKAMDADKIGKEEIAFNVCLLPRESIGALMLDIFMHLRRAMPLQGGKFGKVQARDILAAIPDEGLRDNWHASLNTNTFLHNWGTFKPGRGHEKKSEEKTKSEDKGMSKKVA